MKNCRQIEMNNEFQMKRIQNRELREDMQLCTRVYIFSVYSVAASECVKRTMENKKKTDTEPKHQTTST